MDWHNTLRNKRSSASHYLPNYTQPQPMSADLPNGLRFPPSAITEKDGFRASSDPRNSRSSYFASQYPLYCADWATLGNSDLIALSTFREGYHNKIQVVSGVQGALKPEYENEDGPMGTAEPLERPDASSAHLAPATDTLAFEFAGVAEAQVDYPVTNLQWDPLGHQRIAASSEVLRLYKLDYDFLADAALIQTHLLANNSTAHLSGNQDSSDINTFPPVTSFDWNTVDPSIIITLSVDTTCTVWDLNRSRLVGNNKDTAQVKTQLIAHDLEVFDVQFIHQSTNVFASVSNDGSMRVFDLRSLEHSTIIYEPTLLANGDSTAGSLTHYNPQALLKLSASNIDQHHLATVGVNLNQVLIIDMRMPGFPVVTLDGLFDGICLAAINLIQWHPTLNLLATGGDDCQAVVWDCAGKTGHRQTIDNKIIIDTPILSYTEELEVNQVCWRTGSENWLGVVSGKGFQAIQAL